MTSKLTAASAAFLLLPLTVCAAPPVSPPSAALPMRGALPSDVPANHPAAGSVGRGLHEKILGREPDGRFRGNKPVTRYELAIVLDRFVRYMGAARKPLHAQVFSVKPSLAAHAPPAAKAALQHLVSSGFLPPNSPLVTQKGSGLVTASELSRALADVTIRLSDRAEPPRADAPVP